MGADPVSTATEQTVRRDALDRLINAHLVDGLLVAGWIDDLTVEVESLRRLVPTEEELTVRRARRSDHATSKAGAAAVAPRAGSQRARLLAVYASSNAWRDLPGWTDEEAAEWCGLSGSCYWKRCGELRDGGWIEPVLDTVRGGELTRIGSAGSPRIVCRITPAGRALHATLNP